LKLEKTQFHGKLKPMNALESFLLGLSRAEEIPLGLMTDPRLFPLFYSSLPADHTEKNRFRSSFLAATARHAMMKTRMLELIRAWNDAGIVPMLFKGFLMAEFVYDTPANRYYGDVDVIVREADAARAAQIAATFPGWIEVWNRVGNVTDFSHEESHVFSSDKNIALDLHRLAVHNYGSYVTQARQITASTWEKALEQTWENCSIMMPSAEDCALIGIVLARSWTQDNDIGVKPNDVTDLIQLGRKKGLTRERLLARANSFGLNKIVEAYLQRCDPWQQMLILGSVPKEIILEWRSLFPSQWQSDWNNNSRERFLRAPNAAFEMLQQIPNLLRVKAIIRDETDLQTMMERNEPQQRAKPNQSMARISQITRGLSWALRLLGPHKDPCVPRSMCIYHALKAEGYKVEFVSGVRRNNGKLEGHAWVELNGFPLEAFGDIQASQVFTENFRYPQRQDQNIINHEQLEQPELQPVKT
jgi:hypothetical protein